MPEQAAQAAPQGGGIGVWINRLFLGLCIYVLVFGNPLKLTAPETAAPIVDPNGTIIGPVSTPTPATPQSKSGKHTPLVLPGAKLVRAQVEFGRLSSLVLADPSKWCIVLTKSCLSIVMCLL
jgi:hypothetical protein